MARGNKNFNLKAALIAFGVVGLAMGALLGVLPGILIGAAAGGIGGVMFSPLDTTTHNRQDRERQQDEKSRQIPLTGDPLADPMISSGLALIGQIRQNKALLTDEGTLSASVQTVEERSLAILRCVSEAPEKASRIRKFIHYYLPVAAKLLNNYCIMKQRGVSGDELEKARASALEGYTMISSVCEKQLDVLHSENLMDMDTDLDVLETMLIRDGYTSPLQDGLSGEAVPRPAVTAAEEQLRTGGVPMIQFPADGSDPFSSASTDTNITHHDQK